MNVLIADDEPTSLLILRRSVERLGHTCVTANDGEEAWDLYQSHEFDALISDWMMPKVDGLALCRRIRGEATDARSYCYFIVVTALDDRTHLLEAMNAGADDYLGKPLDRIELEVRLTVAERVTSLHRQLMRQKRQMEHMALHDPLTGLPNRSLVADRIEQAIRAARRDESRFALCVLDLDRFKQVNDTFGHQDGDELLKAVATRLQSVLRASDTVARLGGDEFAVLLPDADSAGAEGIAEKLCTQVGLPVDLGGGRLDVRASIGIAIFPDDGHDRATLMHAADAAMYQAKRSGAGYALSTPCQSQLVRAISAMDAP